MLFAEGLPRLGAARIIASNRRAALRWYGARGSAQRQTSVGSVGTGIDRYWALAA